MKDVLRDVIANAPRLKAEHARLMAEADELVLCGPDCPEAQRYRHTRHAHTVGDMLRMGPSLLYERELALRRRELDGEGAVDVDAYLRRAGVGEIHRLGLRKLDHSRATYQVAERWWKQPRQPVESGWKTLGGETGTRYRLTWPFLLQLGPTGNGKTQAAVWALAQWVRVQPWNTGPGGGVLAEPILYTRVGHLESLPLYDGPHDGRLSGWVAQAHACRALVLDELAAEPLSAPVVKALQDVLDTRYRERRLTLMTSNATATEVEQRLDGDAGDGQTGRLWRRILESGVVAMHEKKSMRLLINGRERKEEAQRGAER